MSAKAPVVKKPKAPPKSWSDIELRYIWDVVGPQREGGMRWGECAAKMQLAMAEQNHLRRRYDVACLMQCWRTYFSDRAKKRGTFDVVNSAPPNRRPPPRPAANNPRPVIKSHYRPQQMLLATNARAPVDWGYGTAEFESAVARHARGEDENQGSVASAVHSDEEDYDEEGLDDADENDEDLPCVNDLTKNPSEHSEVFETPTPGPASSTRSMRPSTRAQKRVRQEDEDLEEVDDSDYEEPVDSSGRKRLKKVVYEEQANSASLQTPGKAGDVRVSNPAPHNVYYTPLGTPHHPEAHHSAPIIKTALKGRFYVPATPGPRQKPGPKPKRPDPEIFKSNPSREALDRHMTHGSSTGVVWSESRIMTPKEATEKKRADYMAERERKIAAGIKVRKLRGPAKSTTPPPLIAPNLLKGNSFTRLQMMQDRANLEKYTKKF